MATFDRKLLKGLWDVTYEFPMFGIRTTIRVRAEDEHDAQDFTVDFFNCIGGGPTTCARPASRQRRKIYDHSDQGAGWRWKPRQKRSSTKQSDGRNSAAGGGSKEEKK